MVFDSCCRFSIVAGFCPYSCAALKLLHLMGFIHHIYMTKCLGKGMALGSIEKLRTVPRKMNIGPCPMLVIKPNLTLYCGPKQCDRTEVNAVLDICNSMCMYFNIHSFTALICVHAVRQLATLLNKFKWMNYVSKWKLLLYH
jgi:hypothetical protein